jgi:hypothetical protein
MNQVAIEHAKGEWKCVVKFVQLFEDGLGHFPVGSIGLTIVYVGSYSKTPENIILQVRHFLSGQSLQWAAHYGKGSQRYLLDKTTAGELSAQFVFLHRFWIWNDKVSNFSEMPIFPAMTEFYPLNSVAMTYFCGQISGLL